MLIETIVKNGIVSVQSPFNKEFVSRARGLQGKWTAGAWTFPQVLLKEVRDALLDCYSVTGESPYPTCVLLITDYTAIGHREGLQLFGRPIAVAYGRDSGAKLADAVVLISGTLDSGGSVKNWYTNARNATLKILDFPLPAIERPDVQAAITEGWVQVEILPASV